MATPQPRARRHLRGASLLEALISAVVVAVGLLATAHWQRHLRQAADLARQQAAAVQVAQGELETLRAFSTRATTPEPAGFDAIGSASRSLAATAGANTAYTVERQVDSGFAPSLKELVLRITWPDLRGQVQELRLASAISGQAPALVLALTQAPAGRDAAPLRGRHAAIPAAAADLPDGRSVFKPLRHGDIAWLFDRRSGRIVARCDGVPAALSSAQLGTDELTRCSAADAVLLSGRVRFALAASADATSANDTPMPLDTRLVLTSTGHPAAPDCLGEDVRVVGTGSADRPRVWTVAASATPASEGMAAWTETGERFWQFHCAVTRAAPAREGAGPSWSGRLEFTPSGWTVGTVAGTHRICRYSADTDTSGAIDRAAESPGLLSEVDGALPGQNFLVIAGPLDCPTAVANDTAAGTVPWSQANPATVPHQP